MSTSTGSPRLSPTADSVLAHLASARSQKNRTKPALRESLGLDGRRCEAALLELQDQMLIEEAEGAFILTEPGRAYMSKRREKKPTSVTYNIAEQNQISQRIDKVENSSVSVSGIKNASAKTAGAKTDLTATPLNFNSLFSVTKDGEVNIKETMAKSGTLPYLSAQAHPARANSAAPKRPEGERSGPIPAVRFLLAFRSMSDSLPIPIFDGDKLGRSRDNQISLPHDAYLSQSHCRFQVRRSKTGAGYEMFVEDLSSRNGTTVNDTLIEPNKPVQIKHGTRLEIGGLELVVVEVPY